MIDSMIKPQPSEGRGINSINQEGPGLQKVLMPLPAPGCGLILESIIALLRQCQHETGRVRRDGGRVKRDGGAGAGACVEERGAAAAAAAAAGGHGLGTGRTSCRLGWAAGIAFWESILVAPGARIALTKERRAGITHSRHRCGQERAGHTLEGAAPRGCYAGETEQVSRARGEERGSRLGGAWRGRGEGRGRGGYGGSHLCGVAMVDSCRRLRTMTVTLRRNSLQSYRM